ncbi:MAG: Gfo/Idh/MocA family oxidoreductase, partial [Chloroflexi bacterium]|nr:Gfo/Idh/MocA family oxidoreductase [Chloroflexota bacterium]
MTDKLRAGIIGCGFTRNHVYGYLLSGRYEVTAICDLYPEVMARWDQEFREMGFAPKHYTDAREMLAKEKLDVISIGTWQAGHARWTVAAAATHPKAIIIEKPIASTLQEAEQQVIVCQRNGVKCIVGHQRRFLPSYNMARDLVAQGAIGQVQLVECLGADGLPNQFTHQTDMLRYVLGDDECEWVMGNIERKTDRWERGTRIEDCAVGVLQFKGGARAVLLADMIPALGGVEVQGGRFFGSEGMMLLSTEELHLFNKDTGATWKVYRPDGRYFKLEEQGHRFEWLEGAVGQAVELA